MRMFTTKFITLLVTLSLAFSLSASTASDAEMHYRNSEYTQAEALYAQLLESSPSNRLYNHRYGVSLYQQKKSLEQAEQHLKESRRQGISLSSYYLGEVCFLLYKFDDAIEHFNNYLTKSNDKDNKEAANERLAQCAQALEMLKRTEDIEIIGKTIIGKAAFFLDFGMSKEAGSITGDASRINEDSIAPGTSIFVTERGDRTFFSLNKNGQSDLFSKNKLLDQWSVKTNLGSNINTSMNEAFPFLMPDGIVLYFSSQGHNTLGGYDIYVTRYNATQDTYLPPQQLGMPFNSFGNDYLLAIDEFNNIGWFASDRDSEEGKIAIYTFKPNASIKLLNTDDDEIRRLAAMGIITDTTEMNEELSTANANTIVEPAPEQHPIYFVVNDTLIYSQLSDFMNKDAQTQYTAYETSTAQYDSVTQTVEKKRLTYSKTIDSNDKAKLISEIMALEDKSATLLEQKDTRLLSARRLELETIKANGGYVKEKPQEAVKPEENPKAVEEHISPWETYAAELEKVHVPFFYDATLASYYTQIYETDVIAVMTEANRMKTEAANKQFMADFIMRGYTKPEPEESFFQKVYAYDTAFTAELSQQELIQLTSKIRDEAMRINIDASYINTYALKGQNVTLMESVTIPKYRSQMQQIIDRADVLFMDADRKLKVDDKTYTSIRQNLDQGANLLRESAQMYEKASVMYLKYRYEKQKLANAKKTSQAGKATLGTTKTTSKTHQVKQAPKANAKTATPKAQAIEYRIQFGIFSRILQPGDVELPELSSYKYGDKQLYKHFTGHYKTATAAEEALQQLKTQGYRDAFVVKFIDGVLVK